MKAKELIATLQGLDPETEIHVSQERRDYVGHVDAHKVTRCETVTCRVDMLGYNSPTVVEDEDIDSDQTYVRLFVIG